MFSHKKIPKDVKDQIKFCQSCIQSSKTWFREKRVQSFWNGKVVVIFENDSN